MYTRVNLLRWVCFSEAIKVPLPVGAGPCNGISPLLNFNTACVYQNSPHDVFSFSLSSTSSGSSRSLIFTFIGRARTPLCLLFPDTLLCPKYVIFFPKEFEQSVWGVMALLSYFAAYFLIAFFSSISRVFLRSAPDSVTDIKFSSHAACLSFRCPVMYTHKHQHMHTHTPASHRHLLQRPTSYQIGTAGGQNVKK